MKRERGSMGIIRRKEVAFLKLMLGRRHILFRILNIEESKIYCDGRLSLVAKRGKRKRQRRQ